MSRSRLIPAHEQILAWVAAPPGPAAAVYEAGPTGFGLARAFAGAGVRCQVAATSKLVRPSGDRVKNHARDAMLLARLLRMDELVPVQVPSAEQEAARDLVRVCEDARVDLMRARHRLSKLLLRHGIVYFGVRRGPVLTTRGCIVNASTFEPPSSRSTPTTRRCCWPRIGATGATGRLDWRDGRRRRVHAGGAPVELPARYLDWTAFALAVEIGDWDRFTGASIGAYVGLVPSEYSSGASRAQGGITKTGNAHGRRLLSPAYAPGPPVWVFALAAMSGPIRYCGGLAAHRLLRG